MDSKFYYITEFARKTSISVRTLRYYDKIGLLKPTYTDESGYKLYTDTDLVHLQSILTFKFLGFSLKDIQTILSESSLDLTKKLKEQKELLEAKKDQINQIINAIEQVESSLISDSFNYESVTELIQMAHFNLRPEWVSKYLSTEDRKIMRNIAKQSYTKETLQKLADRGWTEEEHLRHLNDYKYFRDKLSELVKEGYKVESIEAQELVKFLMDMNNRYSQNDPQIKEGMKKSWERFKSLPESQKPKIYSIPDSEAEFIRHASMHYHQKLNGYTK
ncbi:MerR family transcriptional regulator [Gottfriedia sp. NPDC056225]|uniref:MerR family transcriptional regulator n=1 Tax=Gottfriedia sp. NPDC056225 TaxID=3345751 RepID=UPI0035D7D899